MEALQDRRHGRLRIRRRSGQAVEHHRAQRVQIARQAQLEFKKQLARRLAGVPDAVIHRAREVLGNAGKWRGTKGSFFEGGIREPMISYAITTPPQINTTISRVNRFMKILKDKCRDYFTFMVVILNL